MTQRLTIEQLRLGAVNDLGALSPDTPPPFSFAQDCGLMPVTAFQHSTPASYRNPKLDTYWGPTVGHP